MQIEVQLKIEANPEMANIQVKALPRASSPAATIYDKKPNAEEKMIATSGRPDRSMYPRILGACPRSARAARVREEPYTAELPTLNTAIRITTFIIDGTASIPALRTAITNGEALASLEDAPISESSV